MTARVVTVLGARPHFVKASVVSAALTRAGVTEKVVHTGQHHERSMSDVFFEELGLAPPDVHLEIGGLSHGAMTGRMLEALEKLLAVERPVVVLVYGDTDSTLAGALAATKLGLPVAHVEAGMRSFDRSMPEEINRVVTDHIATLHLCVSEGAKRHLASEGITRGVHIVGDTQYDAALLFADAALRSGARKRLGVEDGSYGIATVHRAGNTDHPDRLDGILRGLERVARRLPLIWPVHPRMRGALRMPRLDPGSGLRRVEPLGYLAMQDLLQGAALILTDSGGLQKEALFHAVPCITLREETEWPETVESGWNTLAGANTDRIDEAACRALEAKPSGTPPRLYGDGQAARRIAELLAVDPRAPQGAS